MPDPSSSRHQLRTALRARRRALSLEQQSGAARALLTSITRLPGWPEAQRLAVYMAADGEIGTGPLADLARSLHKQLLLPVLVSEKRLVFVEWHRDDTLCGNQFGIPEPPRANRHRAVSELDIIFMPLVGWDREGGRLGMGGGYYDRTLAGLAGEVLLVGLAHSFQEMNPMTRETWDIPLDFVATDTGLHRCSHRQIPATAG
ncbi:MAG: 5-formyltetrahydrofolate cyclo-ligase [Halioglobus sp.]|nr:5-formyltetrahydrofolate cyclo-ligase [Halioglobus sp.]